MTKFNVGDKVRILDGKSLVGNGGYHVTTGKEYEIISFHEQEGTAMEHIKVAGNHSRTFTICDYEYKYIELVETKTTKNQRITALEKEVAELKLIVHELRDRPQLTTVVNNMQGSSTVNDAEDIIEFEGAKYRKVDREAHEGDYVSVSFEDGKCFKPNKMYGPIFKDGVGLFVKADSSTGERDYEEALVYNSMYGRTPETVDVYELIVEDASPFAIEPPVPKTANELRAEIVEKAKAFVDEKGGDDYHFEVDETDRTVFAWKLVRNGQGYKAQHGIATCNASDVYNEYLGRAISFGRAEGLDASEFEQAVQPNKAVTGMMIESLYFGEEHGDSRFKNTKVTGITNNGHPEFDDGYHASRYKILNDTNAIYGGVE